MNTYIPEGYRTLLSVYDTQKAIGLLKRLFEDQLAANLNLFTADADTLAEYKTLPGSLAEAKRVAAGDEFIRAHVPQAILDIYCN